MKIKTHELKTRPIYFKDVKDGLKSFELRKNDRGFSVGDVLILMECDDGEYTGRETAKIITYKLSDFEGLKEGYCILGLGDK